MNSSRPFLLLDDPPGTIAVVSGIESILVDFVGQVPRLDWTVGGPLVYSTGGGCLAGLLHFLGGGEAETVAESLFQPKSNRTRGFSVIIQNFG